MNAKLPVIIGFFMAPLCIFALFWQWSGMWVLCPQALMVMFVRQWQHAYDSLGAADYPDLAVAAVYYPIVGGVLHWAVKTGRLKYVATAACLLHLAAIGIAWGAAAIRNRIWAIG